MQCGPVGERRGDLRFRVEDGVEAREDRCAPVVPLGEAREQAVVARLRLVERPVEVAKLPGGQRLVEEPESLAAPGLHDPEDDQSVQEVLVHVALAQQPVHGARVGVGLVLAEAGPSRDQEAMHLAEVREFFAGELDHRVHEIAPTGVVSCELERRLHDLPLGMGVVLQEGVEVRQDGGLPLVGRVEAEAKHGGGIAIYRLRGRFERARRPALYRTREGWATVAVRRVGTSSKLLVVPSVHRTVTRATESRSPSPKWIREGPWLSPRKVWTSRTCR